LAKKTKNYAPAINLPENEPYLSGTSNKEIKVISSLSEQITGLNNNND